MIILAVLTKTAKNLCPRSPLPPVPVSLPSLPLGLPAELQLAAAAKQREQQQQQQQQQAEKRRQAAMEEIRAAEAKRRRVAEREDEEMSPRYGIIISFLNRNGKLMYINLNLSGRTTRRTSALAPLLLPRWPQ